MKPKQDKTKDMYRSHIIIKLLEPEEKKIWKAEKITPTDMGKSEWQYSSYQKLWRP
jgi:hypothetical protein